MKFNIAAISYITPSLTCLEYTAYDGCDTHVSQKNNFHSVVGPPFTQTKTTIKEKTEKPH